MKKALLLLLILMLSLPACAESALPEVNWSDFEAAANDLDPDGRFVTLDEVAMKFWLPSPFLPTALSAEDAGNDIVAQYEMDDCGVAVQYMEGDPDMTVEAFADALAQTGDAKDVERGVINGLEAVNYTAEDADGLYVTFVTESGNLLQFIFWPMSEEGMKGIAAVVVASIQPE